MEDNIFAKRLKEIRKEKGYTQKTLAECFGYNKSAICDWETRGKEPNFENLIKLCKILDVSVDYILGVSDNKKLKK